MKKNNKEIQKATFGGGCFWCVDALFRKVKGVIKVTSGYAGGNTKNPTYEEVSTGKTGHAEVVQIEFNPDIISYSELLDMFWEMHDPTTLNRQGPDTGTQYRSIILYHTEDQKKFAMQSKRKLAQSEKYKNDIVTEIKPLDRFYAAEEYHQNFYARKRIHPYCVINISPKIKKFKKRFAKYIIG